MPGMSGRELADQLHPLRPEMKVLFISGYTDNIIEERGMLTPGTAFLQKPFSPRHLAAKVREVIDAAVKSHNEKVSAAASCRIRAVTSLHEIQALEQKYLLQTYARYPLVIARGKGVYVYDTEGNKYLDLVGGLGVNTLGHAHPRIVKTIREQAAKVIAHLESLLQRVSRPAGRAAVQLSGLDRAFFANSGTEAMEGALKLARALGTQGRG